MSWATTARLDRIRSLRRRIAVLVVLLMAVMSGTSSPASARTLTPEEAEVHRLYRAVMTRDADPAGLSYWWRVRETHGIEAVAGAFLGSDEFALRYGANASDERFVDLLYRNALGRSADPGGRAFWLDHLRHYGRSAVLLSFSQSVEFQTRTGTPPPPVGREILRFGFDTADRGFDSLTRQAARDVLGGVASCSEESELAVSGGTLRMRFRPTSVGSRRLGCSVAIPGDHTTLWLQYKVMAEPGWVPVKGGKLPGFSGGAGNTGGNAPRAGQGFSARNMWNAGGNLVQYTYHQGQRGRYGDSLSYHNAVLQPGRWHTVTHRVRLNDPGQANGVISAWFDGRHVLQHDGLVLRGAGHHFAIDKLRITGFYGGNDPRWAPPHTTYMRFDDIVVADGPLR